MRGRLVTIAHVGEEDLNAWQDLADHAVEPNPLFEPACLVPAARHLPNGGELRLVVAEENGTFMGCFPVVRTAPDVHPSTTWRGVRRPAFSTQVRRNRYDSTPLVRADRGEAAFVAMFSTLAGLPPAERAGTLVLEAMSFDGPTSSSVLAAAKRLGLPFHIVHSYERPLLCRRAERTPDDLQSGKARRDSQRRERQLGEKLGGPVELIDRSCDAGAVQTLLEMEAAGYKGWTEGRRSDRFSVAQGAPAGATKYWPGEPEWFVEMCDRFRSTSRLVLYSLEVGGTIVAMQLMLRGGPGVFGIASVFDEDYSRYSPGLLLQLKANQRILEATDAQWHDTCTYEGNDTLLRIYPDRRHVSTVVIALGGFVDRTRLAANVRARRFARKLLAPGSPLRANRYTGRLLDWTLSRTVH